MNTNYGGAGVYIFNQFQTKIFKIAVLLQMEYEFSLKFKHPFAMLVAGPSSSGKSVFTKELVENNVEPDVQNVFWFYTEWQSGYDDMPANVHMVPGMPSSLDKFLDMYSGPKIMVFDDLMAECVGSNLMADAFTKKRHHRDVSVILILQNLFCQGKVMRTVQLNTQYFVLFANARDKSQFFHFARQVEPTRANQLMDAYTDATSKAFHHFLVDLKPTTPNALRYRSESLSQDKQIVYTVGGV